LAELEFYQRGTEGCCSSWIVVVAVVVTCASFGTTAPLTAIAAAAAIGILVLHQAIAAWEKSSDDPRVREEYYSRRKAVLDEKAAVREAELRLKEGIERGLAEGKAIGKEEGKAEVARNLIDLGVEISKIAKATGLSEEDIRLLKN